jgi:hypothetical protein
MHENPESGPYEHRAAGWLGAFLFDAMLLAAKGLAMTVLDILYRPGMVDELWAEFRTGTPAG